MLSLLSSIKSFFKRSKFRISGQIFRLHTLTTSALLCCTLLLAAREYVGTPIACLHGKDLTDDVLNTYCWTHSTFSFTPAFRSNVPHSFEGMGTAYWYRGYVPAHPFHNGKIIGEDVRTHKYYQWVSFCLFFQVLFLKFFSSN